MESYKELKQKYYEANKMYEERVHRLGLLITDKERELKALQKEHDLLDEEWGELIEEWEKAEKNQ